MNNLFIQDFLPNNITESTTKLSFDEKVSFVEEKCLFDEPDCETRLADPQALVDVFADDVLESAHFFEHLFGKAHIEGSRKEFVDLFGAAADAARRHQGGHGVVDGQLRVGKVLFGAVGTSVAVHIVFIQFFLDNGDIVRGEDAVGIEEQEVVAGGQFHALVPENDQDQRLNQDIDADP